jgi:hypothetical protein
MREIRETLAAALLASAVLLVFYEIDPGFFCKDDFQLQYLPGSREVTRAIAAGELPLLTPYSWICAALGGEFQFGVFSLFRVLLESLAWLLPFSLTGRGAFLFIVHASIAAAGAYRLARSYEASVAHAMMTAVIAALNGWVLWWGTTWYPGVASFAWLPWYWLGMRGILDGRSRWSWLFAALSLYLLASAGWPYSLLMAAAVAAMCFLTALGGRRWRAAAAMVGASLLGALLAAPAVLMLLEYYRATVRAPSTGAFDSLWVLPVRALFALLAPTFTTNWEVFVGTEAHASVELAGAAVAVLAIAGAWQRGFFRNHRPELLLIVVLVVLMLIPGPGPFRWSFRWLPLFHLALAVVGASALGMPRARRWLVMAVVFALNTFMVLGYDRDRGTTFPQLGVFALLCVAWWLFERRRSVLASWMPVTLTIVSIAMTFVAHSRGGEVPRWRYEADLLSPGPLDPDRRYLAMYGYDAITVADERGRITRGMNVELRPGNVPMLAGLHFLNGYSPLGLAAVKNVLHMEGHGPLEAEWAEQLLRTESGPQQLLHHLGVDGIVLPLDMTRRNREVLARNGWRPASRIGEHVVLHREARAFEPFFQAGFVYRRSSEHDVYREIFVRPTEQLPVVILAGSTGSERYGARSVSQVSWSRQQTSFVVAPGPKALFVFRRPWMPGWRVSIDGRPLPVLRAHMIMPAVEIPAGAAGEVRLVYRPTSLVVGAALAGLALLVLVGVSLWLRFRALSREGGVRPPLSTSTGSPK